MRDTYISPYSVLENICTFIYLLLRHIAPKTIFIFVSRRPHGSFDYHHKFYTFINEKSYYWSHRYTLNLNLIPIPTPVFKPRFLSLRVRSLFPDLLQ